MGAFNSLFRHLFQINGDAKGKIMSSQTILFFAIGVFILMAIGVVLTMIEFNRITEEPSLRKGTGHAPTPAPKADDA